jgi:hypothetical protein
MKGKHQEHFNYIQGCCYYDGKIISLKGFNSGSKADPVLKIVDLNSQKVVKTYDLSKYNLTKKPEVVYIDNDGVIYFTSIDGILRKLI